MNARTNGYQRYNNRQSNFSGNRRQGERQIQRRRR
jgi:hypothetical protein